MALDTLIAYRAPTLNMAPLAQIAAPVLPNAPTLSEYRETLLGVLNKQCPPRVRNAVETVLGYANEVLARDTRGVPVADLPLLFLQPDLFPNASRILNRHNEVISGMRQSVQDLHVQLPPQS
jgi:hypothetical protein